MGSDVCSSVGPSNSVTRKLLAQRKVNPDMLHDITSCHLLIAQTAANWFLSWSCTEALPLLLIPSSLARDLFCNVAAGCQACGLVVSYNYKREDEHEQMYYCTGPCARYRHHTEHTSEMYNFSSEIGYKYREQVYRIPENHVVNMIDS